MKEIPIEEYLTSLNLPMADHIRSAQAFNVRAIDILGVELSSAPLKEMEVGITPKQTHHDPWPDGGMKIRTGTSFVASEKRIPKVGEIWAASGFVELIYNIENSRIQTIWMPKSDVIIEDCNSNIHLGGKADPEEVKLFKEKSRCISWKNLPKEAVYYLAQL